MLKIKSCFIYTVTYLLRDPPHCHKIVWFWEDIGEGKGQYILGAYKTGGQNVNGAWHGKSKRRVGRSG